MTRDTLVLVLGIDVGTSGLKAVLLDPDGNTVDEATASYGLCNPRPGWTEQDPGDWWTATREALATLWSRGNSQDAITGVGLTGQTHSLALLDAAGNVLAHATGTGWLTCRPPAIQSPGTARPDSSRRLAGANPVEGGTRSPL